MSRFRMRPRAGRLAATVLFAAPLFAGGTAGAQEPAAPRVVTLEEVIELALRHDPASVSAEASVSVARADLLQARGSLLPSITANSFYNNSSDQRFDQTTGRLVSESYTAQLQGTYELFTGGRRWVNLRAADAGLDAADAAHREQRFNTILRATEQFYATAAAADLVAVAERRLERARQQHEFAEVRFDVGTATRSDLLRAEIEMSNAELAVYEAMSALRSGGLELGRLMGVAGEVRPTAAALPDAAPALAPVDRLVELARQSAPALLSAEATARTRRAERLAAITPYLPSIRLSGGYDWFAFEFPPDQQSWSLRVFASLPLFNGFQREAALQRASALERMAEARARDAALAVRTQVESAAEDIRLAERRVAVASRTVALAEEDLRVQEERYQMGAATILELQASQVALAQAEVDAVRSRQALGGAVARLEAVLGETLTEERAGDA